MRIRVLIVDDSAFVRKAVRRMLTADSDFEVVGEAADGRAALDLARELVPDVITLDIQMPGWDGIEALERILSEIPTSIVIFSSYAQNGAELTLKALTAGAVDVVDKSRVSTMSLYELEKELVAKLKAAASSQRFAAPSIAGLGERADRPRADLFVLGASTGGPRALQTILSRLPLDFAAQVLVVQHMPRGFSRALADRLDEVCPLAVRELETGDALAPGEVGVAPGGSDVSLEPSEDGARIAITPRDPRDAGTTPSIDRALESAASYHGATVCAVILTGMGEDGLRGCRAVRAVDGIVIAEAPATCIVYGMPRAVTEADLASVAAPLHEIPGLMLALSGERRRE